jgi:hypothetical protein
MTADGARRAPLDRVPVGLVSFVSIVFLGVLAIGIVLDVVPRLFTIESECFAGVGRIRTSGDSYNAGFVVLGTFGWLGVAIGTLYASIAGRRGIVLALPVAWFLAFVGLAVLVALAIGPTPCPQ